MNRSECNLSNLVASWAPLTPVAIGLIAGSVIADGVSLPGWFYSAAFPVVAWPLLVRSMRRILGAVFVLASAACVGGALFQGSDWKHDPTAIAGYATQRGRIVHVQGRIASEPLRLEPEVHAFSKWTFGSVRTSFLFDVHSLEGTTGPIEVSGRIRVVVNEPVDNLVGIEPLSLFGRLYEIGQRRNPGSFDWAKYMRRAGVQGTLRCEHQENVQRLSLPDDDDGARTTGLSFHSMSTWVRRWARSWLVDDILASSHEEATLLETMVLGLRSRIDRELNEQFTRAGCAHFLAVSGANVAMLLSMIWLPCRLLGIAKRRCAIVAFVVLVLYMLATDPRPPILRAGLMAGLFCFSQVLQRGESTLNWLSAAAIVLVLSDPQSPFDIGFQLSFAAVVGIRYLSGPLFGVLFFTQAFFGSWISAYFPTLTSRLPLPKAFVVVSPRGLGVATVPGMIARALGRGLVYSLAAWLVTAPIVAYHFRTVQLWGSAATMALFPVVWLFMLYGFLKIVAAAISPTAASAVTLALSWTDGTMRSLVSFFADLPAASVNLPGPPVGWIVVYYVFLMFVWARFRNVEPASIREQIRSLIERRPAVPRWIRAGCWTTCAVAVIDTWLWLPASRTTGGVRLTVLAVGRGSATVIELPDGSTVLYDAGTNQPYDVGRRVVEPFLRWRGIPRLERIYISHANLDHFSGVPSIARTVSTGAIVVTPQFRAHSADHSAGEHLLELLRENGHTVETLDPSRRRWEHSGVSFELLWPDVQGKTELSPNDSSMVLRLTYAGHSIMLTGDIEERAQRALLAKGDLKADVLLLPHHGSMESTTGEFLKRVAARYLIRSSHERMADTLNGLRELVGQTPVYNTADMGAVEVGIDESGVRVGSATE